MFIVDKYMAGTNRNKEPGQILNTQSLDWSLSAGQIMHN